MKKLYEPEDMSGHIDSKHNRRVNLLHCGCSENQDLGNRMVELFSWEIGLGRPRQSHTKKV